MEIAMAGLAVFVLLWRFLLTVDLDEWRACPRSDDQHQH